jgi:hypothetical protein
MGADDACPPSGCASPCCGAVSERCPLLPGKGEGDRVSPGSGLPLTPALSQQERGYKPSHGTVTEKSDVHPPRRHGLYWHSSSPTVHNRCRGWYLAVGENAIAGEAGTWQLVAGRPAAWREALKSHVAVPQGARRQQIAPLGASPIGKYWKVEGYRGRCWRTRDRPGRASRCVASLAPSCPPETC